MTLIPSVLRGTSENPSAADLAKTDSGADSGKTPITDDEREAITMLRGVTFTPASWDKRFAAHLQDCLRLGRIGEKAKPQLWRIFIRYRRQTSGPRKAQLLRIAEQFAAPDYRKQQAALAAQARINEMRKAQ